MTLAEGGESPSKTIINLLKIQQTTMLGMLLMLLIIWLSQFSFVIITTVLLLLLPLPLQYPVQRSSVTQLALLSNQAGCSFSHHDHIGRCTLSHHNHVDVILVRPPLMQAPRTLSLVIMTT